MNNYYNWITSKPKSVLVLTLLITLILGAGLAKLKIDNNQESELPKDNEIVITNDRLDEIFGEKGTVLIGVKSSDSIYQKDVLALIDQLSNEIKTLPFVIEDEVTSLSTFQNLTSREWGLERDPFLKTIPSSQEAINKLKEDVKNNKDVYGKLASQDGNLAIISAYVEEGYNQTIVTNAAFALTNKYEREDIQYFIAGDAIQAQEIDSGIQEDTGVLLPSALILILVCFLLTLRSMRGVLLPFSVVILSIIWTMGAMGWLGLAVTVVSSALPALMVAVASSYGIHFMLQYYEQVNKGLSSQVSAKNALSNIAPAIAITGATSALGALTLLVFKVTSIQEFGAATAIGVLSAMVLSLTFIPSILSLQKPTSGKAFPKLDAFIDKHFINLGKFSIRNNVSIAIISTVFLAIISWFGISQLKYGQDFIEYFEEGHRLRIAFDEFNTQLGGARYLDVMIEAPEENGIQNPTYLKQMLSFQKFAESLPHVGHSQSFANIITQINRAMHDNNDQFTVIPDDENTIAQYQLLYSMSGSPGSQSNLIDYDNQRAKIRIMLTTSEQDDHKWLYSTLKEESKSIFAPELKVDFGGDIMFWLAQIQYIVEGKILNILASILVVFVFCAFIFRAISAGLLSIVPLSIATLLTLSMMGFLGIRLDVGTAIVTAIGVGIGVDFTIHYFKRLLNEYASHQNLETANAITAKTAGKAIAYDTLSNVAGFSVFILSGFQPLQFFGWLISLMMITSALATLLIFPAIISLLGKQLLISQELNDNTDDSVLSNS